MNFRFFMFTAAIGVLVTSTLSLAGPLTPPAGPVTSTGKTLTEVEPRIAINATNTPGDADSVYKIVNPGSYYLTENLIGVVGKCGIKITAQQGVTIDLMGYSLRGTSGTLQGIRADSIIECAIRNGHVSSWGSDGVKVAGNSVIVEDLTVSASAGWGVYLETSFPNNRITRVTAGQNSLGGINAGQLCLVEQCSVYFSSGPGISASTSTRVEKCSIWNCNPGVQLNNTAGIVRDTSIFQCPVGILASGSNAQIEHNIVNTGAGLVGLRATTANNTFLDNTVVGTGDKYDFVAGNRLQLVISQLPESIDWPAEVRIAGALSGVSGQNGLTINSDDVSVDLGGNSLIGIAGSLDAINVAGSRRNISVRNGSIRAWGGDGVDVSGASSSLVESIRVSDNTGSGVRTGERAVVRDCIARSNGMDNIIVGGYSQVIGCVADASTGGHGINASFIQSLVKDCTASSNAQSGVRSSQRTRVQGCVCSNNTLHGVHVTFAGIVEDCFINANSGDGILMDAGGGVTIRNNTISESNGAGDAGIRILNAGLCHIESNQVELCTTGILVSIAGNVIIKNTSMGCATNFNIIAGNTTGPVITSATAATATNPLANLTN